MKRGSFFRTLRITFLVLVLFFVSMNSWLTRLRTTDWNEPLWVVVYPVNGDGSDVARRYIDSLEAATFQAVSTFMASEAARYDLPLADPVTIKLAPLVDDRPPSPPADGNTLGIMLWSLRLRYWAWRNDTFDGPRPDVRMFVVYHDPEGHPVLQHSLGIRKGLIGVVNAFAGRGMAARNNVVIAHEFLHTTGASDKYDPATNLPLHPIGYAEPDRAPLFPQRYAEIMGGRIPLSGNRAVMPSSLRLARIGAHTAMEIRWRE